MLNVDDVQDAVGNSIGRRSWTGWMIPLRPLAQRYDHPMYERRFPRSEILQQSGMRLQFFTQKIG